MQGVYVDFVRKLAMFLIVICGLYAQNLLALDSKNTTDSIDFSSNSLVITPPSALKGSLNAEGILPQVIPNKITLPRNQILKNNDETIKLEFLISYKALSQNGIITGEKYNISEPLVKKAHFSKIDYVCKIDTPINNLITDNEAYAIKYILKHYQDDVLSCLNKTGIKVRYDGANNDFTYLQDSALLDLTAKRIVAYFDNRYLILEILKEIK